jgi:hypothetical protein
VKDICSIPKVSHTANLSIVAYGQKVPIYFLKFKFLCSCYGMLPGQLKPHTIPCHILKFPEDQSYCVRCFIAAGPVRDFLDSSIIESWHSASHYEICAHNKEKKLLGSRRKCFVQVIFAALLAHPGSLRQNAINQFGGKNCKTPDYESFHIMFRSWLETKLTGSVFVNAKVVPSLPSEVALVSWWLSYLTKIRDSLFSSPLQHPVLILLNVYK